MKPVNRISHAIAGWLAEQGSFNRDDYEIYQYGIQLGLTMVLNGMISAAISLLCGMLWEGILFFALFIPLRSYAGGYHSDTPGKCTLWSQAITCANFAVIRMMRCLPAWAGVIYIVMSSVICVPEIIRKAPGEAKNKPLSLNEREVYKRKVRLILAAEILLTISSVLLQRDTVALTAANVFGIQRFLLAAGRRDP